MKRVALFFLMILMLAQSSWAVSGIEYTPHNFASTTGGAYRAGNEDEICIFCHTPHGGDTTGPLWNRDLSALSAKTYNVYNSVALKAKGYGGSRTVNAESLLCLSCHDGSIGIGDVINQSNRTGAKPDNDLLPVFFLGFGAGPGPGIGDYQDNFLIPQGATDALQDDHPISFSYYDIFDWYSLNGRGGELQTIGFATTAGIRFFPEGAPEAPNSHRVECSSCHDPHVDYGVAAYGSPLVGNAAAEAMNPFLVRSNIGSGLCLACHNK